MRKELLEGLTEEQIKKAEACQTASEILALAKEEGIELNDEQLEAVSGGCFDGPTIKCPTCKSKEDQEMISGADAMGRHKYKCGKCGERYWGG